MTKERLVEVKRKATILIWFFHLLPLLFLAIPMFFIIVFNPLKLLWTLGALVGIF